MPAKKSAPATRAPLLPLFVAAATVIGAFNAPIARAGDQVAALVAVAVAGCFVFGIAHKTQLANISEFDVATRRSCSRRYVAAYLAVGFATVIVYWRHQANVVASPTMVTINPRVLANAIAEAPEIQRKKEFLTKATKWEMQGHGLLLPGDDLRPVPYNFPLPAGDDLALIYGRSCMASWRVPEFTAIQYSNNEGLVITFDGKQIVISGTFYDSKGASVGRVEMNEVRRDPKHAGRIALDFTSEEHTVIVKDTSGAAPTEILKVWFVEPRTMRIHAHFYTPDGHHLVIDDTGVYLNSNGFELVNKRNCDVGIYIEGDAIGF